MGNPHQLSKIIPFSLTVENQGSLDIQRNQEHE